MHVYTEAVPPYIRALSIFMWRYYRPLWPECVSLPLAYSPSKEKLHATVHHHSSHTITVPRPGKQPHRHHRSNTIWHTDFSSSGRLDLAIRRLWEDVWSVCVSTQKLSAYILWVNRIVRIHSIFHLTRTQILNSSMTYCLNLYNTRIPLFLPVTIKRLRILIYSL